jgi:hypothetical protein
LPDKSEKSKGTNPNGGESSASAGQRQVIGVPRRPKPAAEKERVLSS